jgi:hypothetical protein
MLPAAMKKTWLFLVLSPLCLAQEAPDFCDLLKNMETWNGKLVQLRGVLKIWSAGEEGGSPLAPKVCDAQIRATDFSKIPPVEFAFPNLLELTDPQARTALHKVDFQWDSRNRRSYANIVNRVDRDTEQVNLTVVGVFETRIPLARLVFRGAEAGFGHAGGTPGQILVKRIEGMVIEKK